MAKARLTALRPKLGVVSTSRIAVPTYHPSQKPSQQSGYRIRGREGQRLRAESLSANPLCVMCLARGLVTAATEVDHIIALTNGGEDTLENRQGLCRPCHEIKTLADLGLKRAPRGPLWRWEERASHHRKNEHIRALLHPEGLQPSAIPLTIVCGPAGAGKSTYIRQQAKHADTVIDMDMIRVDLGIGPDRWDRGTLERSLERRNAMLAGLATATAGRAWFIVSAAPAQERQWWQDALQPERMVLVLAGPETCIKRIRATRTGTRAERACRAARQWWASYRARDGELVVRSD